MYCNFVFEMNVGVDIETISRFGSNSEALFTPAELAHAGALSRSLAGIWCGKEAVVKAMYPWKVLTPREVEITWIDGRPRCSIQGFQIALSISHDQISAIAFAIVVPVG